MTSQTLRSHVDAEDELRVHPPWVGFDSGRHIEAGEETVAEVPLVGVEPDRDALGV